ncbi:MAG: formylglycine-generating enzyme family protein, partial [Myxococcales bacterium]|nr:formylglycine-generating enzyme family protein [Myxococcales bacterium]
SPATEEERWGNEGPRHRVRISRGFWLGEMPVTQALWEQVMGANPSQFKGAKRPVERVSWEDCQAFLERLNGQVRELDARLPSEAEWEYACRATSESTRYGELDEVAWHSGNSGEETHAVGLLQPNQWGLYDMLGNVWEWCADCWQSDEYASRGALTEDPPVTDTGGDRVFRGGSWLDEARVCRAALRGAYPPGNRGGYLGFRLARAQGRSQGTGKGATVRLDSPTEETESTKGRVERDGGEAGMNPHAQLHRDVLSRVEAVLRSFRDAGRITSWVSADYGFAIDGFWAIDGTAIPGQIGVAVKVEALDEQSIRLVTHRVLTPRMVPAIHRREDLEKLPPDTRDFDRRSEVVNRAQVSAVMTRMLDRLIAYPEDRQAAGKDVVDVLIVTALTVELEALLSVKDGVLEPWTRVEGKVPYHVAIVVGRERSLRVAATQLVTMGGSGFADVANLIAILKPRSLAMCGVCAGNARETSLGDVVVVDRVYDIESESIISMPTSWIWEARAMEVKVPPRGADGSNGEGPGDRVHESGAKPHSIEELPYAVRVGAVASAMIVPTDDLGWEVLAEKSRMVVVALDSEAVGIGRSAVEHSLPL